MKNDAHKFYNKYLYDYISDYDCLYFKEIEIIFSPKYALIPTAYIKEIHDYHHKTAKEHMTR